MERTNRVMRVSNRKERTGRKGKNGNNKNGSTYTGFTGKKLGVDTEEKFVELYLTQNESNGSSKDA